MSYEKEIETLESEWSHAVRDGPRHGPAGARAHRAERRGCVSRWSASTASAAQRVQGREQSRRHAGGPAQRVPARQATPLLGLEGPRASRERECLDDTAPLFVSRLGRRLSLRQVRHGFTVWQDRAGFERRLSFHSLRHSACSTLYRRTKDIRLTQRFARHKSQEQPGRTGDFRLRSAMAQHLLAYISSDYSDEDSERLTRRTASLAPAVRESALRSKARGLSTRWTWGEASASSAVRPEQPWATPQRRTFGSCSKARTSSLPSR